MNNPVRKRQVVTKNAQGHEGPLEQTLVRLT